MQSAMARSRCVLVMKNPNRPDQAYGPAASVMGHGPGLTACGVVTADAAGGWIESGGDGEAVGTHRRHRSALSVAHRIHGLWLGSTQLLGLAMEVDGLTPEEKDLLGG